MSTNQVAEPAAWIADFCDSYAPFTFTMGKWMLITGCLLGVAMALVTLVTAMRALPKADMAGQASATGFVDSLKDLIDALGKAPPWIALFGGGAFLLWMAGTIQPVYCQSTSTPGVSGGPRAGQSAPGQPKASEQPKSEQPKL